MFCSGCGRPLETGQFACPQCGRPVAQSVPFPGFDMQVAGFAGKVRTLGVLWIVYAGLSLVLGFAGLTFAKAFLAGNLGHWMHGPMPPAWIGPAWIHFVWVMLCIRAVLYAVAGWGLLERTQWGRVVAIVAAILSLVKVPFGTALGIATLVILLGSRNWALYDQFDALAPHSGF